MIRVNDGTLLHSALFDGHVERVQDERRVLSRVNGPTHDAATARVEHAAAIDLAFSRGMLGDVADPKLVQGRTLELALDQIVRRRGALDALDLARPGDADNLVVVHQNSHEGQADVDAATLGQLGVHAARTVRAAAGVPLK